MRERQRERDGVSDKEVAYFVEITDKKKYFD